MYLFTLDKKTDGESPVYLLQEIYFIYLAFRDIKTRYRYYLYLVTSFLNSLTPLIIFTTLFKSFPALVFND